MKHSRISLALEAGFVLPDAGRVAVIGARAGDDISALPKERVQIVQAFKPDHDYWASLGYDCATDIGGEFASAVVFLPRSKLLAQVQIAEALSATDGGPVWIDGQKTDGIDSLLKQCRKLGDVDGPLSKGHGKLFALTAKPSAFEDWRNARSRSLVDGFVSMLFRLHRWRPG